MFLRASHLHSAASAAAQSIHDGSYNVRQTVRQVFALSHIHWSSLRCCAVYIYKKLILYEVASVQAA